MVHLHAFVTAVTERTRVSTLSSNVPRLWGTEREKSMSLGAMAFTGLVAAVILIVGAITLINKLAQ